MEDEGEDGGDKAVLVRDRGSSPVLVKIIRALTPKQRPSTTDGGGGGRGRPTYARQSSVNRVFQIVKEGLDGVRFPYTRLRDLPLRELLP